MDVTGHHDVGQQVVPNARGVQDRPLHDLRQFRPREPTNDPLGVEGLFPRLPPGRKPRLRCRRGRDAPLGRFPPRRSRQSACRPAAGQGRSDEVCPSGHIEVRQTAAAKDGVHAESVRVITFWWQAPTGRGDSYRMPGGVRHRGRGGLSSPGLEHAFACLEAYATGGEHAFRGARLQACDATGGRHLWGSHLWRTPPGVRRGAGDVRMLDHRVRVDAGDPRLGSRIWSQKRWHTHSHAWRRTPPGEGGARQGD